MTISITDDHGTVTISRPKSGPHISEFVAAFRDALLALGFHPDNVKEHLGEPQ